MHSLSKKVLFAFFICLVFIGAAMIFINGISTSSESYSSQSVTCSLSYSTRLNPGQIIDNVCTANAGGWLSFSITSQSNVTAVIWLGANSNDPLYVQSGNYVNAHFPLLTSDPVNIRIQNNAQNVNSLSGSLSTFIPSETNITTSAITHPYRTLGISVVTVSFFACIFFGLSILRLYPRKTATVS